MPFRAECGRGLQYLSIRYPERLAEAGIEPSVDSVGDPYDNVLAESVIGLHKTEVIHRGEPWRHLEAVEFATLEWGAGGITAACSSRSATFRRRNSGRRTIFVRRLQPWRRDSCNQVFGKAGAVHRLSM
jgi:hypothetical protein